MIPECYQSCHFWNKIRVHRNIHYSKEYTMCIMGMILAY